MFRSDTRWLYSRSTVSLRDESYVQILLQVFNVLWHCYGERDPRDSYNDVPAGERQKPPVSKTRKLERKQKNTKFADSKLRFDEYLLECCSQKLHECCKNFF